MFINIFLLAHIECIVLSHVLCRHKVTSQLLKRFAFKKDFHASFCGVLHNHTSFENGTSLEVKTISIATRLHGQWRRWKVLVEDVEMFAFIICRGINACVKGFGIATCKYWRMLQLKSKIFQFFLLSQLQISQAFNFVCFSFPNFVNYCYLELHNYKWQNSHKNIKNIINISWLPLSRVFQSPQCSTKL